MKTRKTHKMWGKKSDLWDKMQFLFLSTEETSFHNSDVLKHMINNQLLDL